MSFSRFITLVSCCCSWSVRGVGLSTPGNSYIVQLLIVNMNVNYTLPLPVANGAGLNFLHQSDPASL